MLAIMPFAFLSGMVNAQLRFDEAVIEMKATDSVRYVDFHNTSNTPLTIQLEIQRVVTPEFSDLQTEQTLPVNTDVVSITPKVLEIPGKKSKIKPVRGPNSSPIVVNYDLLLLVRPTHPQPQVTFQKTPSGVSLINKGNSNVLLSSVQLCDVSIDVCNALPSRRLYAQQRWSIPSPEHFNSDALQLHAQQTLYQDGQVIEHQVTYLNADPMSSGIPVSMPALPISH